jgi:hypothetical protein
MFRAFSGILGNQVVGNQPTQNPRLFLLHPLDLTALLELAWDKRQEQPSVTLGRPFHRSDLNRFEDTWLGNPALTGAPPVFPGGQRALQVDIRPLLEAIDPSRESPPGRQNEILWDHLIYAYMIENTRSYEVFRRVVYEFAHGERLGSASPETQHWLRSTEELFYRDPPSFFISAITSHVRPDQEATRRNNYQRLLGMDLNHGAADNKPYSYVRAEASNKEFVSTFEELLREVWIGIINANNVSGAKATDDGKLQDLTKKLNDMLLARRVFGTLSREEFVAVSMMSWFHLTLESNNSIVKDLRAEAESEEQRLYKIAQQVGVPAHGLSASFFEIADDVSRILLLIETGLFSAIPGAVAALYTPGAIELAMRKIITHWSIISGRDMKAGRIAPSEGARRPS